MEEINFERSKPIIYAALEDEDYHVRRKAVFILLNEKPEDGPSHLRTVLEDEDFETRFYAQQAIRLIEEEQ
jgi:HEAT repeat protein